MKKKYLASAVLAAFITTTSYAAPNKPSPEPSAPQDVNVVNIPTVTVANPQGTMTVDNTAGNPVPVTGNIMIANTNPIPVSVQTSSVIEYEFVGYSTEFVNVGSVGYQAQVCRNTFGPLARWATSREVRDAFEFGSFTQFPNDQATIRGEYTHLVWDDYYHRAFSYEPHAEVAMGTPGCGGGNNQTVTLSQNGIFGSGPCYATAINIVAACSLPK